MRTHRFETSVLVAAWLAGIGCEASATRSLAPAGPSATDGIVVESAVPETIGTAQSRAGRGRTAYEAAFPFANCDRGHRFEIADIDVEPA